MNKTLHTKHWFILKFLLYIPNADLPHINNTTLFMLVMDGVLSLDYLCI